MDKHALAGLQQLVNKCTAFDPDERPNFWGVVQHLHNIQRHLGPVHAPNTPEAAAAAAAEAAEMAADAATVAAATNGYDPERGEAGGGAAWGMGGGGGQGMGADGEVGGQVGEVAATGEAAVKLTALAPARLSAAGGGAKGAGGGGGALTRGQGEGGLGEGAEPGAGGARPPSDVLAAFDRKFAAQRRISGAGLALRRAKSLSSADEW